MNCDTRIMVSKWYKSIERTWLHRLKHYVVHDILHVDDTPHRIALGIALGFFVALTPTIPFQMILTFSVCWLFKANKVVGLPIVWVTNPATVIPIFAPMYLLGCWVLGLSPTDIDFRILVQSHDSLTAYAEATFGMFGDIFWPLWVGSFIVAAVVGILSYFFSRQAIKSYRKMRPSSSHSQSLKS